MKPLILDYAINRKQEVAPIYEYDYKLSLNVINCNNRKIPFIESNNQNLSLLTKTVSIPRNAELLFGKLFGKVFNRI